MTLKRSNLWTQARIFFLHHCEFITAASLLSICQTGSMNSQKIRLRKWSILVRPSYSRSRGIWMLIGGPLFPYCKDFLEPSVEHRGRNAQRSVYVLALLWRSFSMSSEWRVPDWGGFLWFHFSWSWLFTCTLIQEAWQWLMTLVLEYTILNLLRPLNIEY